MIYWCVATYLVVNLGIDLVGRARKEKVFKNRTRLVDLLDNGELVARYRVPAFIVIHSRLAGFNYP